MVSKKHIIELDHHDLDKIRYFLEKPHHDRANARMHDVIRKHKHLYPKSYLRKSL